MTHQQSGVVKALIAFSIKFNLAAIAALTSAAIVSPISVEAVAVNAVFPVALTYKNTVYVV